jgi:hypothetical protein
VSFLLHNDHGFDQAPMEEIDVDTYNKMVASVTPITSLNSLQLEDIEIENCDTGACPIR